MVALPLEQFRALAPQTVVWAPGGTRRQAALEGVPRERYFDWAWEHQFRCVAQFFRLGVQTLFVSVLGPPQVREIGPYREQLAPALARLCDEASLAAYMQMGAQVRFYGQSRIPGLAEHCARIEEQTRAAGPLTLWYELVVERETEALEDALRAASAAGATSLEEAVRAFYGQNLAPVDVFIGFGKTQAGYLLPPLLGERADLYWTAFPSYMLSEEHLRDIFWDHRFARATWTADKSARYQQAAALGLGERHQEGLTLGVGERVGPFWYPRCADATGGQPPSKIERGR